MLKNTLFFEDSNDDNDDDGDDNGEPACPLPTVVIMMTITITTMTIMVMRRRTMVMMMNLLAPCQQLTNTLAFGLLARLDRIHMPRMSNF